MSRSWTVACLAGDGCGPELMAEASRVLGAVARLHALSLDDVHLPFGSEAFTRFGHPLPRSTREAYRRADAILVSSPAEPALDGVRADLDLAWQISRVLHAGSELAVVGPVAPYADEIAIARAFDLASARRGRIASVGGSPVWRALVAAERERRDGLQVEEPTVGEALVRLRDEPGRFDVLVADARLAGGLADAAAHLAGGPAAAAVAWLPEKGPGVFAPYASDGAEVAGLGVADPSGTLLAAALLLAEGLGRRSAARTLERAVTAAGGSRARGTRGFADAVIDALPDARTDTELFEEVWR